MSKPNHFARHKPVVILLVKPDQPEAVLKNEDGTVKVFPKLTKAQKFVSQRIEPELWQYIHYANEKPEAGAGDREETNNKRCLKCDGFLRPSGRVQGQTLKHGALEMEEFLCPVCDLGEKTQNNNSLRQNHETRI